MQTAREPTNHMRGPHGAPNCILLFIVTCTITNYYYLRCTVWCAPAQAMPKFCLSSRISRSVLCPDSFPSPSVTQAPVYSFAAMRSTTPCILVLNHCCVCHVHGGMLYALKYVRICCAVMDYHSISSWCVPIILNTVTMKNGVEKELHPSRITSCPDSPFCIL
jgi:hypothetical protein